MNMDNGQPQKLFEIIPDDIFVGTSLILRQGNRFLYGIRPIQHVESRQILELTGIGGGLEDEDKSLSAGAIREAQEEIGCGVGLISCPTTLVVRNQNDVEQVTLEGEHPAAVVFRNYRTPPHQPWHQDNQGQACLIVFVAELKGQPRPAMELPHLIWLKPEHILETARDDVPLGRLLNTGAELIVGNLEVPPESSWVRLTDSQEALAIALGNTTLSVYNSLGTR
jgi:8-oxo-dGTP pyrophosphatase MutT (NUDIX family)